MILISNLKAEHITMSKRIEKSIKIQQFINKVRPDEAIRTMSILEYNQIKHIDIIHYHVKKLVKEKELLVQ